MSKNRFSKLPVDSAFAQDHRIPTLPANHPERVSHEDQWLAHVQAGRIGKRGTATRAQLMRHIRNELVLMGADPLPFAGARNSTPTPTRSGRNR